MLNERKSYKVSYDPSSHEYLRFIYVSVHSVFQDRNTKDWVALTTETYFSQFWRLEVQDQGASRFGVQWEIASWFIDGCPFLIISHGKRELLFYKGTNPFHEGSALIIPQRPYLQIPSHWGNRFQHMNIGRTQLFIL